MIAEIGPCSIRGTINLIFYTIASYLVYTYILQPIFNAFYSIYYYQRFHCLPRNPFLGNLRRLMPKFPIQSPLEEVGYAVLDELVNTSADRSISVLWLGPFPLVVLSDHRAVEAVMTNSNVDKPFFYKFVPLSGGLVSADAVDWKVRRKVIEPFFGTKQMKRYVEIMDEGIKSIPNLLAQWIGKPVEIDHSIHSTSLNVICKISASIPLKDLPETKEMLIDTLDRIEKLAINRIANPLYWLDSVLKFFKISKLLIEDVTKVDPMLSIIFDRRREELISTPPFAEYHDLIDILEPHTNHEGVTEELMATIIAGHSTVSVGLRWTLFALGNHVDMQDRVYQEIMDHFPNDEPVDDLAKIKRCTYLDRCLKESLRLFPPVHSIGRVLTEDVMVKDKKLLKGTSLVICIKTIHRDPSVYPNPTKYDPERWNPENIKNIPKAAFIPFSYGPRNCIGYRYAMTIMKVYLVHVLRQYSVKSTRKEDTIRTRCEISNKPNSPLEIILSPRNNNNVILNN